MRCWKKAERLAAWGALLVILAACTGPDSGARLTVAGARLLAGDPPRLRVALQNPFEATVLEALHSGVALRYAWTLELYATGGERLATREGRIEVNYRSFTRWYTLSGVAGGDPVALPTITDTERLLAGVELPLEKPDLPAAVARARFRIALDVGALPPPLRLPAYLSREWRRDSGWHEFPVDPEAYD